MRGQKLFVRPTGAEDAGRLAAFYRREEASPSGALDSEGLIGFLVGDPVAHLAFRAEGDEVEIVHIWTAKALRRMRIARIMVGELAELARKVGARRLVIRRSALHDEPFLRLGFVESRAGMLERALE